MLFVDAVQVMQMTSAWLLVPSFGRKAHLVQPVAMFLTLSRQRCLVQMELVRVSDFRDKSNICALK